MVKHVCFCTCILVSLIHCIQGCLPEVGWQPMSRAEKLFKSDIVLTGRDIQHIPVVNYTDGLAKQANMIFKVYCVLKGDGQEINENITVHHILPETSCDHTYVEEGMEYIVTLQRYAPNLYTWYLPSIHASAVSGLTNEETALAVMVCGLQDVKLPSNSTSTPEEMCPKPDLTKPCIQIEGSALSVKCRYLVFIIAVIFSVFNGGY